MSALEKSLRKVFKLPSAVGGSNRFLDGTPIPSNMRPRLSQTLEFRDVNQNGIEDRAEGIYRPKDLELIPPEGSEFPRSVPMPSPEPDPNAIPRSVPMPMPRLDPNAIPRSVPMPDPMLMPRSLPDIDMGSAVDPMDVGSAVDPMDMGSAVDPALREQARTILEGGVMAPGLDSLIESPDEEEQETIDRLLKQEAALEVAPLGGLAKALREQGLKEDTELAHLRLGEVVLPPEFLEDDEFADQVEKKFDESGINPEEAVVGGIGSLNPTTGLQQFFLKKVFKGIKKVVKKVAPYAGLIAAPFTGGATAALIGGLGGAVGGGGIKGALKGAALGGIGSAVAGGIRGAGGIGGFFNRAKEFILPGTDKVGLFGNIRKGIGSFFGGPTTPGINPGANYTIQPGDTLSQIASRTGTTVDALVKANPSIANRNMIFAGQNLAIPGTGGGGIGGFFRRAGEFILPGQDNRGLFANLGLTGGGGGAGGGGGFGGFGGLARNLGIGGLAYGLGRLAYKDAQKQKGVPLTPLTTMSPTGRYNIEAEIARRTGQPIPNPIEFGLAPANTFPELSGAKPVMASLGGAIEELEGGMAQGMQDGGSVDKMRGFAKRAEQANAKIGELEETFNPNNLYDFAIGNLPLMPDAIGNILSSVEKKEYDAAKLDFAASVLRRESGAIISDSELKFVDRTYFPQIGDSEEMLETKKRARNKFVTQLKDATAPRSESRETNYTIPLKFAAPYQVVRKEAGGGGIMAFAQGGAVAMQEGGEMDPNNFPPMDGDINGPGTEQSDDIPAMLSDGEFVMTARAVRGAGSYEMKTEPGGIINLIPSLEEDRERGMDVMYKVMDTFSEQAKPS